MYAMVNCFQSYPRTSIRVTMSSSSDSKHRVQHDHVELKMKEMSQLGHYAMNGGEGPNSYAQNSSYQVYIYLQIILRFNLWI